MAFRLSHIVLIALLIFGVSCKETTSDDCKCDREAILLHNIKELDFVSGLFTASRRVAPVPQMDCVGGSAQGSHLEPLKARCVNVGLLEPHWRCEATMDDTVQLGTATVTCEGYEAKLDPYVLKNSCGLSYTLEYTSWSSYMFGYLMRGFNKLIIQPLKWIVSFAGVAFIALVITALIRRPAHRNQNGQTEQGNNTQSILSILFRGPVKSEKRQERRTHDVDEEEEDEEEETPKVWEGRLRNRTPRSQNSSPVKDISPRKASPTGMAAR